MAPVLIATQSNLSYLAARMGYQELIVYPIHGVGKVPHFECDQVVVKMRPGRFFAQPLSTTCRI